jgi:KipI family sensor histidine kinase inhibitor
MTVRLLPMGPCAVMVDDLSAAPARFAAEVVAALSNSVVDVVPGAETVLVTVSMPDELAGVERQLEALVIADDDPAGATMLVEIPVVYDGPDLDEVAASAGMTVDDVIEIHSGAEFRVDFCGFAPGFGYLSGLPEALHLPRRNTPRTRVPAGAVAIASSYSAVYPTTSPGGWHLIGSTSAVMFDPTRTPPALLEPGMAVKFVAT